MTDAVGFRGTGAGGFRRLPVLRQEHFLNFDGEVATPGGLTAEAYGTPLRHDEPRIFMGGGDGGMFADPMTLQPGEPQQVARRLREVLTA